MRKQNQIDPFGEGHQIPNHRSATFAGNRSYGDSWVICDMDPEWKKDDRKYELLFFLDEATALAAGFRPCNRCRRKALEEFRETWNGAVDAEHMTAEIDRRLREEGTVRRSSPIGDVPVGAMIRVDGDAHLVVDGGMRRWSFEGYGPLEPLPTRRVEVITPASTTAVIAAGYSPQLHPSAI
jgi:hypothetical protein